jgi:two-component system sensor histidine kinase EvgS
LNSLHNDLQQLDQMSHEHDRSGLRELAHHIKGGAQMVGAARLVSACTDLEEACRAAEAVAVVMAIKTLRDAMHGLAQRLET